MPETTTPDYSEFVETVVPKNEEIAGLMNLVQEARRLEIKAEVDALALASTTEKLRDVLTRQIPAVMEQMGMKEFQNQEGLKIEVKEEIHASISEANRPEAFKWLEENKHGGLIKREISIAFNREQQEEADKLLKELQVKFAGVCQEKKVHPSTLKSWAKEMLEGGKDVPAEIFGIFKQKIAKIGTAKAKKNKRA